ncbi:MAG: S1 RNA-binding domain-containing protein [Ilumatobacteraceae bacterium]
MTDLVMPRHVVVDGSNLATEGRPLPSLKQLNEAVLAYMAEHPDALITVVVDATFGHRIDAKEVAEFDAAVSNNEIVAPPAGAIGRGDAFVLSIANKVNATILSNDSYQEFHGTHTWLFDEGRLVGGKPVPHIGWVFVNRLPVRGPTSRKSVSEAKRGRTSKSKSASPEASQPMPIPAAPPPGATLHKSGRGRDGKAAGAAAKSAETTKADAATKVDAATSAGERAEPTPRSTGTNDLLAFLTFVEHHKPGSSVNAIVENYSSHGAYVRIGDVKGYVPLSLMADPPPRSAREFMKIGESITLVVESFAPARRSIDLAIPTMTTIKTPPPEAVVEAKPRRVSKKAASKAVEATAEPEPKAPPKKRAAKKVVAESKPAVKPAATKPRAKKAAAAALAPLPVADPTPVVELSVPATPPKKRGARKPAVPPTVEPAVAEVAPAKPTRRRARSA